MRRTIHYCGYALSDHGPAPYAVNVPKAAQQNDFFRSALWTGRYLQMTLMCIPAQDDIGLEVHPDTDQYIRVEEGQCMVKIGSCRDRLELQWNLGQGDAVFVPAGCWHNVINTGCRPLKLSSVYAPPQHPRGTLHQTKQDAEE